MTQIRRYSTAVENICVKLFVGMRMPRLPIKRDPKTAANAGGRPAVISREKVLEAARQLRPHELTMKAVAQHLCVQKASLYYYFSSKHELLAALGAELVGNLVIPSADPAHWRRWLERAAISLFEIFCANPVFLGFENYNQFVRAVLPLQETAMETLEGAGFPRDDVLRIWRITTSYVYVAAAGIQEAAQAELEQINSEIVQVLNQIERIRPMPRVRSMVDQGLDGDPRKRFAETLAWQIKNLPDPVSVKLSRNDR